MTNLLSDIPAIELGQMIEKKTVSSLEITQDYLSAIKALEVSDRIYSHVSETRALASAQASDERTQSGKRLSPLDGVPTSWKDLFDTADIPTEAGTKLLEGRIPKTDCKVVRNGEDAGLVCLGKTHMSELAFTGLGLNQKTATTPCVNDLDAVSGGSSSGAAGSVAFGLAAAGIGSDTGGSVRIPSAWNDLVGLKTTSGDISLQGVVPLCVKFDTVGPLCKTVEDASAYYDVLKGREVIDRPSRNPKGLKFLNLTTVAQDDLDDGPKEGFEGAVSALINAGCHVEDFKFDAIVDALGLSGVLFTTEAYNQWKPELESQGDKMYPQILERFLLGKEFSQKEYKAAWVTLSQIRNKWTKAIAEYDGVIVPTSPISPPNLERLMIEDDYYVRANLLALRNTRIGNLMRSCVMTLPTSKKSAGIAIIGAPNSENDLITTCRSIEAVVKS